MTLCIEPAGMNARVYWRETEDDDDPRQGWYWVEVDDEGNALGSPAGPYQSAITAGSEARQAIVERSETMP
jgi:hypothetical protein